jgi:Cu2+-exporting ATPase
VSETVELAIEGMSCGHCEKAVKKALEALPGVEEATASAAQGKAVLKVAPGVKLDRQTLARAVEEAGYRLKG